MTPEVSQLEMSALNSAKSEQRYSSCRVGDIPRANGAVSVLFSVLAGY